MAVGEDRVALGLRHHGRVVLEGVVVVDQGALLRHARIDQEPVIGRCGEPERVGVTGADRREPVGCERAVIIILDQTRALQRQVGRAVAEEGA